MWVCFSIPSIPGGAAYGWRSDTSIGHKLSAPKIFALKLIKTIKCLPILFYGVEACPTNSSVRQSFEFTMNKILFKVFGATSKDSYRYIYECFGIDNADQFIRKHQDKFINKFCASNNLCRMIYRRQ